LLGEKSYAQTCASLVLRMERQRVNWSGMEADEAEQNVITLLNDFTFTAEVVRSRLLNTTEKHFPTVSAFSAKAVWSIRSA
jgi:hypothetical protein